MSNIKIAILGSCVSRDLFEPPLEGVEVVSYWARTSLATLFAPSLPFDAEHYAHKRNFEFRCTKADFRKTVIEDLKNSDFDYLIMDFIDERFHILQIDDSAILCTGHIEVCGVKGQSRIGLLSRDRPATMNLWKHGARRFFEELDRANIPQNKIILHEAIWAETPEDPADPQYQRFDGHRALHTELLENYFSYVKSIAPRVRRLRIKDEFVQSDPDSKWGLAPFHYTASYYKRVRRRLTALLERDKA